MEQQKRLKFSIFSEKMFYIHMKVLVESLKIEVLALQA